MNVFLTGFMGSGKTNLGRQLAGRLDRSFLDLDDLIEKEYGQPVKAIFEQQGEAYFRKLEADILGRQYAAMQAVVSLGGGACCSEKAWKFLRSNGWTIFIKAPEDILFGRLRKDKKKRPLIAGLNDDELKSFIFSKLKERTSWYDRSDLTFEKDKMSIGSLAEQVRRLLRH